MHKFFLALALLSISVSTGAIAQQQQRSGTPEEQKACSRDVQRFCRPVIDQGDFTILACLQQHRPKLSQGLRSGAEKPRPIGRRPHPRHRRRRPLIGLIRARRGICEKSQIALVLASYSPIWGSRSLRMRASTASMRITMLPDECSQFLMTSASELRSGKTHRDENFPVASWIIHPRHRALILAFYNFVRTADDIADHATLERAARSSGCSICSKRNCWARATPSPRPSICGARWRNVRCRRATRSMC